MGQCDAIVITPPESIDAQRKGCKYLIEFAEFGLNYALAGLLHGAIMSRTIRTSLVGSFELLRRYRSEREFTNSVQTQYSGISDRNVAEETYDLTRPGMPAVPDPAVAALQILVDFMGEEILQKRNADGRRFVDDRFIRELDDDGALRQ